MRKIVAELIFLVFLLGFLVNPGRVFAVVSFKSGDILDARNITAGETVWSTTVRAKNLDEIEFRVLIENVGDTESTDVHIRAGFALDPGSTLENKIYLGVWSASQATGITDIEVNSDTEQKIVYVPGKSIKFSNGCDSCPVSDNIATAYGTYVGKVKPGEKIEIRFRAQITDRQKKVVFAKEKTTPTPTPVIPHGSGGAAVADATPNTGFTDPIWLKTLMWLGFGTAGIKLRQMAGKMSKIEV